MKKLGRMVALILTFSLLLASSAFAATKASSQILKHSIDITANKGGEIAIEVSVTGNGLMKQIGVEKITVYLRHRPEPLENSVFATVSASLIFPVSLAFSLAGREQGKFFILLRLLYPAVVQKNALSPLSREHRYSVLCRPLNGQAFPEHP